MHSSSKASQQLLCMHVKCVRIQGIRPGRRRPEQVMGSEVICCAAAPELAGWGEQLGGGVERRTVVNPFPRAVGGLATVIDISHGQHLHVRCDRTWASKR